MQATKAYGGLEVQPPELLTSAIYRSCLPHVPPASLPGKEHRVLGDYKARGWAPEMICAFWRTDATMAPAGIQTTISGTPSNCPVSTWTVLSPASIAFGNAFSGLCISNILFVYFIGIL